MSAYRSFHPRSWAQQRTWVLDQQLIYFALLADVKAGMTLRTDEFNALAPNLKQELIKLICLKKVE